MGGGRRAELGREWAGIRRGGDEPSGATPGRSDGVPGLDEVMAQAGRRELPGRQSPARPRGPRLAAGDLRLRAPRRRRRRRGDRRPPRAARLGRRRDRPHLRGRDARPSRRCARWRRSSASATSRRSRSTASSRPTASTRPSARYATFDDLLAYCALSADPVGELVLHVFGAATPDRIAALRRDLQRPAGHRAPAGRARGPRPRPRLPPAGRPRAVRLLRGGPRSRPPRPSASAR